MKDAYPMPRITDIFLIDSAEQLAVASRSIISPAEIPAVIGRHFEHLGRHVEDKGLSAADTPFVRILGLSPEKLEVTVGLPVREAEEGRGIQKFLIPAGPKIICYWQGDNSQMFPLYEEMNDFAGQRNLTVKEGLFEYYLNGPEYGKEKLLTKVMMLLTDREPEPTF